MRKLALFAILAIALTAAAQEETMFGFRSGLNISSISTESSSALLNGKNLLGLQFGLMADMNLFSVIYFQPGVMFASKGGIITVDLKSLGYDEITYKPYYLELPIALALKVPLSDDLSFALNAGGYASVGLFGKIKRTMFFGSTNTTLEAEQEDVFSKNQFKRLDYGATFGGGFDFEEFYVGLHYSLGLNKVSQSDFLYGNSKAYTRTLTFIVDAKF